MKQFAPIRTLFRPLPKWTSHPKSMFSTFFALVTCLLAASVLAGCKKEAVKGTILAQVGNSTLTLEELRESFPAEYEQLIRREQYLDFIKRWIDDEVLYQQAAKGRLAEDPQVKRKLDKLMRKLLIEEFLARENASEAFEPDEMAMNQYYEMHKDDFRRKAPEIRSAHIRVQVPKLATDLRWKILTDNNFLAQAAAHSLDPVPESVASLTYKKESDLPPCLAGEVAATKIGANTSPLTCPDGLYIVRVLDRQEAGSLIPFPEAKEEISATLLMDRKDRLLDGRIAKFKEGIAISYNLDQIPGLTEAPAAAQASGSPANPGAVLDSASVPSGAITATAAQPKPRPRIRPAPAPASESAATATGEGAVKASERPKEPPKPAEPAKPGTVQEENANVQKPQESTP